MFGASTYSILKIEKEKRETKGRVTSSGRWGGFMKASTHGSGVGVDIAASECDCTTANVDAA